MLKLRKQAIKEKTKAELAWLEQQKKLRRNKGADDTFPREKKRKVLLRLHKEQVSDGERGGGGIAENVCTAGRAAHLVT